MPTTEKIKKAFDEASLASSFVTLNEEQANSFVDFVVDESTLLKKARLKRMTKPIAKIGKVYADGRFLRGGSIPEIVDSTHQGKRQKARTATVTLQSKPVWGEFMITDEELDDNIEGQSFEEHFVRICAKKVANELEQASIYGRKKVTDPDESVTIEDMFNGYKWLLLDNGHVIEAPSFTDRYISKEKMAKLLKAIPTKHRLGLQYFMPSDGVIDYALLFDTIADASVRADLQKLILGKPRVDVPLMRVDEPVGLASPVVTAVDGDHDAGDTTILVDSITGLGAGVEIVFNAGTVNEFTAEILSSTSSTLTLTEGIPYDLLNNATVTKVTRDGYDILLTNPMNFIYGIQISGQGFDGITFERARVPWVGFRNIFKMRCDIAIEEENAGGIMTGLLSR